MSEKRYQVFISSTFKDLTEERKAIMDAILNLDCFPSGMEMFPASNMEQFEYIKRVIEESDYYILVVAGKYGSISEKGISYTEMEYDYAKEKGVPILTFIKKDINQLAGDKIELDPENREKLEQFRSKISINSLVKYWNNIDELKYNVYDSLSKATKMIKRTGWVKGDITTDTTLLRQINDLRIDNSNLRNYITTLEDSIIKKNKLIKDEEILQIDDSYDVNYTIRYPIYENDEIGYPSILRYDQDVNAITLSIKAILSEIGYYLDNLKTCMLASELKKVIINAMKIIILNSYDISKLLKYNLQSGFDGSGSEIIFNDKLIVSIKAQFEVLDLIEDVSEDDYRYEYKFTEKAVDIIMKSIIIKKQ